MLAYTYIEHGKFELIEKPKPGLKAPRDAIVRVTLGSICTSDLHIKHGSVPRALPGTTVGHEMVGIVEQVGADVTGSPKSGSVPGTASGNTDSPEPHPASEHTSKATINRNRNLKVKSPYSIIFPFSPTLITYHSLLNSYSRILIGVILPCINLYVRKAASHFVYRNGIHIVETRFPLHLIYCRRLK